jgi:hypothetical protein
MSKHIILILSIVLLIVFSIYLGICCYTSIEGVETMSKTGIYTTSSPAAGIISGPAINPLFDTTDASANDITKYNKDNLNVQYHDDLQAMGSSGVYSTKMGTDKVYDVNGNLVDVISNAVQGNIVYYQPGSYKYGASTYVPYYEDSVFLSRSTNAVVNTPTFVTTDGGGGFCNKYHTDPIQLEHHCNAITNETCAATTCCVLLGGQKCVAGTEAGPVMKDNYSDFMIANKDFYYYQGKCYGNCPNTPQFPSLPKIIPNIPSQQYAVIYTPNIPNMPGYTPMPPMVANIPPPPPDVN